MVFRSQWQRNWDPMKELERVHREMSRYLNRGPLAHEAPAVNIWRGADGVVLTAEVAGMDPEQLDVTVVDDTVTIRGNRPAEQFDDKAKCHRRERKTGQFVRTLQLPFRADVQRTEARYERGILTIKVPQHEAEKPQKIAVTA